MTTAVAQPVTCCAKSLQEVESAWALVYRRYAEMGLIDENSYGVHAMPQLLRKGTCVIYQELRGEVISTMTVMTDSVDDLPLDSVYHDILNDMRGQNWALVEVGMLADRRHDIRRTAMALYEIMRWAGHYILLAGYSHVVVGVHPHHIGFYERSFGFSVSGEEKEYPTVNKAPVVLLDLPLRERIAGTSLPRGLKYVRDNPVPEENFADRFSFAPDALQGSRIEGVLNLSR